MINTMVNQRFYDALFLLTYQMGTNYLRQRCHYIHRLQENITFYGY